MNGEENQPMGGMTPPTEEKSTGAIIGAIIIVVLLVIGGLYYLSQRAGQTPAEILSQPDVAAKALQSQGTSDEVAAIGADAGATNLTGLDAELGDIKKELTI